MRPFIRLALFICLSAVPMAARAQSSLAPSYGNSITLAQAVHLIEGARSYAEKKSLTISIAR